MAADRPSKHAPKGPLLNRDPMPASDPLIERCKAHSKQSGERCKRRPIPGGTVCRWHGGAAPQVKEAAMARLMALQHPAIDRMSQLIAQDQFPTVAYQASRDVLDRTLGKPQESVALTGAEGGPLEIIVRVPWRDPPKS